MRIGLVVVWLLWSILPAGAEPDLAGRWSLVDQGRPGQGSEFVLILSAEGQARLEACTIRRGHDVTDQGCVPFLLREEPVTRLGTYRVCTDRLDLRWADGSPEQWHFQMRDGSLMELRPTSPDRVLLLKRES